MRFAVLALSCLASASAVAEVRVRFEATLPRHFQGIEGVFLSGSEPALGSWKPDALPLRREGDRYVAEAMLPPRSIELKLTLGAWDRAETLAGGKPLANRKVQCDFDCRLPLEVENFALKAFHPVPRTVVPGVTYHHDFFAEALGNYRSVAVYLPPGYRSDPARRYPVLYALDGNNLFDTATATYGEEWGLDETLDRLIATGRIPPLIAVAVYNTSRRPDEYLYCPGTKSKSGGHAEAYARFLVEKIKTFVDSRYRTLPGREHTGLLGSSFGGHFALFAAWRFPEVFGRVASISTAYWWADYRIEEMLSQRPAKWPMRLWMDMGDREGWDDGATHFKNGVHDLRRAESLLRGAGVPSESLRAWVEPGGIHRERSWGARAPRVLEYLFSP